MNITKWIKNNCDDLTGKRVVITGATGGLGKEICYLFAELNADITLACRNPKLADALKAELNEKYPNAKVDFAQLDLSSIESVNNCIDELKKYNGIDILINNAGVYNVPLKTLELGYNNVFQINFVSTYYLTKKLLPELEKKENSTCITLGSVAHNYSKLSENDIDFSNSKKNSKVYGNSKRFLMCAMYELFKNQKVKFALVHPGVTLTNMTNHYHWSINWFVKIAVKLVFPKPKKASLSVLYGIKNETPYHTWIGPSVFNIWGYPKLSKLKTLSEEESKKMFEIAEDIYKKIK